MTLNKEEVLGNIRARQVKAVLQAMLQTEAIQSVLDWQGKAIEWQAKQRAMKNTTKSIKTE